MREREGKKERGWGEGGRKNTKVLEMREGMTENDRIKRY